MLSVRDVLQDKIFQCAGLAESSKIETENDRVARSPKILSAPGDETIAISLIRKLSAVAR